MIDFLSHSLLVLVTPPLVNAALSPLRLGRSVVVLDFGTSRLVADR
jgi:hypothetical protein